MAGLLQATTQPVTRGFMRILGLDIGDPGDYQAYRDRNMWGTVCRDLIKTAAGLAYDILVEEKVVGGAAHTGA